MVWRHTIFWYSIIEKFLVGGYNGAIGGIENE